MNVFACPTCNAQQSVSEESEGKQIPCSKCGAQMAIPVMETAAVPQPPPAPQNQPATDKPKAGQIVIRRRRRIVPYIVLGVLFILIAVAFFTNPPEQKFREQTKDNRSLHEKLIDKYLKGEIFEDLVLEKSFERKNMFIYSVGTYTVRNRLSGKKARFEFIGAYGKWWLQYPINVSGELIKI